MENLKDIIKEYQDYLAPLLDTYEQAIYLYIFRHSRLIDEAEVTIGFKSSRKKMAFGVGEKGKPMSEHSVYTKLASLAEKKCIQILDSERSGTRVKLCLPSEIEGIIPGKNEDAALSIDEMDFFSQEPNRLRILSREANRCFYCMRAINKNNYVIEHVVSRPEGNNSYRNVVAACRQCNNRKGEADAEGFLRNLYRESLLTEAEFQGRLESLKKLLQGNLKPELAG